jgi:hypothetical protein
MKRTFTIHDNYRRPFLVTIEGKHVVVYAQTYNTWKRRIEPVAKVLDLHVLHVFLGTDPLHHYIHWDSSMKGNTILLHVRKRKYIYIGRDIYSFRTMDTRPIQLYFSPIGCCDVPYPYAISDTYTYLMLEHVAIENRVLNFKKDIYGQFYGYKMTRPQLDKLGTGIHTLTHKVET